MSLNLLKINEQNS